MLDRKNKYIVVHSDQHPPEKLDIAAIERGELEEYIYFGKALYHMEQRLRQSGLTIFITLNNFRELPEYGDHVVVLLIGEERFHVPKYVTKVRAIFSGYLTPFLETDRRATRLNLLKALYYLNLMLYHLPGRLRLFWCGLRARFFGGPKIAAMFPVPIGYFKAIVKHSSLKKCLRLKILHYSDQSM